MNITTHSKEEMYKEAAKIAAEISGGEVLGLQGDLGTGKTEFVRGLAQALGSEDMVKSPSFTLLNLYRLSHATIKHLVHVDLYRLKDTPANALSEIGLDEWFGRDDALIVIEWPEALAEPIEDMKILKFDYGGGESERTIEIKNEA